MSKECKRCGKYVVHEERDWSICLDCVCEELYREDILMSHYKVSESGMFDDLLHRGPENREGVELEEDERWGKKAAQLEQKEIEDGKKSTGNQIQKAKAE